MRLVTTSCVVLLVLLNLLRRYAMWRSLRSAAGSAVSDAAVSNFFTCSCISPCNADRRNSPRACGCINQQGNMDLLLSNFNLDCAPHCNLCSCRSRSRSAARFSGSETLTATLPLTVAGAGPGMETMTHSSGVCTCQIRRNRRASRRCGWPGAVLGPFPPARSSISASTFACVCAANHYVTSYAYACACAGAGDSMVVSRLCAPSSKLSDSDCSSLADADAYAGAPDR